MTKEINLYQERLPLATSSQQPLNEEVPENLITVPKGKIIYPNNLPFGRTQQSFKAEKLNSKIGRRTEYRSSDPTVLYRDGSYFDMRSGTTFTYK